MMKIGKLLPYVALILVVISSGIISFYTLTYGETWGNDFSLYLMQAKSIVMGTEKLLIQQSLFTISQSTNHAFNPLAYPWGFPIILAPIFYLFGLKLIVFKVPAILFYMSFLVCIFFLFKDRISPWTAVILVAVFAFNPVLISEQDFILSDIPFLAFSTLSIFLIDCLVCKPGQKPLSLMGGIILGISIFLAFFIRLNGVLLLVTLFMCQVILFHSKRESLHSFGEIAINTLSPYIVFGILWGISLVFLPAPSRLDFSLNLNSIKENIIYYIGLGGGFFNSLPGPVYIYGILLVFSLVGIVNYIKRDYPYLIYSLLTIALFIVYPNHDGLRYIFPILPFFILFAFQGMTTVFFRHRFPTANRVITAGLWGVSVVVFAVTSISAARTNMAQNRGRSGPFDPVSTEMFKFINKDTPAESVIIFEAPNVMRLLTGRNSIMIDECSLLGRGNFVVLQKSNDVPQVPLDQIGNCNIGLEQIFENIGFVVYKVNK